MRPSSIPGRRLRRGGNNCKRNSKGMSRNCRLSGRITRHVCKSRLISPTRPGVARANSRRLPTSKMPSGRAGWPMPTLPGRSWRIGWPRKSKACGPSVNPGRSNCSGKLKCANSLERQLTENQRRLAEMTEQASAATDAPGHNQMTMTMGELNEMQAQGGSSQEAPPSADERAAWDAERASRDAERKQLEVRIADLEQKLADPTHISQTMTLGGDALAELQSQSASERANEQVHERIAELEARLNALKDELAQAVTWQDRCHEALATADEARARAEGLAAQVTELQSRLDYKPPRRRWNRFR